MIDLYGKYNQLNIIHFNGDTIQIKTYLINNNRPSKRHNFGFFY